MARRYRWAWVFRPLKWIGSPLVEPARKKPAASCNRSRTGHRFTRICADLSQVCHSEPFVAVLARRERVEEPAFLSKYVYSTGNWKPETRNGSKEPCPGHRSPSHGGRRHGGRMRGARGR